MTVNDPSLVQALVLIMALIILVQGLSIMWILLRLNSRLEVWERRAGIWAGRLMQNLKAAREVLQKGAEIGEKLPEYEVAINRSLIGVRDTVQRLDAQLASGVGQLRSSISRFSRVSDVALSQFQRQTTRVHGWIRHPAVEASALMQAGTVILRQLFKKEPSTEPRARNVADDGFVG